MNPAPPPTAGAVGWVKATGRDPIVPGTPQTSGWAALDPTRKALSCQTGQLLRSDSVAYSEPATFFATGEVAAAVLFATGFDGLGLAAGFGGGALAPKSNSDVIGVLWLTPPL